MDPRPVEAEEDAVTEHAGHSEPVDPLPPAEPELPPDEEQEVPPGNSRPDEAPDEKRPENGAHAADQDPPY